VESQLTAALGDIRAKLELLRDAKSIPTEEALAKVSTYTNLEQALTGNIIHVQVCDFLETKNFRFQFALHVMV
jgi:hypothetical protein